MNATTYNNADHAEVSTTSSNIMMKPEEAMKVAEEKLQELPLALEQGQSQVFENSLAAVVRLHKYSFRLLRLRKQLRGRRLFFPLIAEGSAVLGGSRNRDGLVAANKTLSAQAAQLLIPTVPETMQAGQQVGAQRAKTLVGEPMNPMGPLTEKAHPGIILAGRVAA